MEKNDRIYVAGHRGMVGSNIMRELQERGFQDILTVDFETVDLRNHQQVMDFFSIEKPQYVFLAAARVGGIQANRTYPADFLYDNLMIQNNIFSASLAHGVKKLLFLGTSCIYPRECPQPMKEEYLLTGPLEPTNEGYALAKIAGLKLAEYLYKQHGFKSVCPMPSNLYGTNDSFDPEHSHVLSALVRKFVDAAESGQDSVSLWGSGIARREFLHVEDLARIVIEMIDRVETPEIINIGTGTDISIQDLATLIASRVGYHGKVLWDASMPDGMLRKCMDVTKMHELGFVANIDLQTGIDRVIIEYKRRKAAGLLDRQKTKE
jgi:GDP-L-fucose synthase